VKYEKCCSDECRDIIHLPPEVRRELRNVNHDKYAGSKIYKSKLSPFLMKESLQKEQTAAVHG
jgi:hypothetical protein